MKVNQKQYKTVWIQDKRVCLIEQNRLPFDFQIFESDDYRQTCHAIKTMVVRGAGAIGVTAGYAMLQAVWQAPKPGYKAFLEKARKEIENTRPTAQNLFYATKKVFDAALLSAQAAEKTAAALAEEDMQASLKIGEYGNQLIPERAAILTHCNAGWLAFVDYGTALAPVYAAKAAGKEIFVYADETRPRGQGARLTAWELKNENIPHAIIPDNAAAHFMAQSKIGLCIVGADRIARNGDVANKIGTLEKAIVARFFNLPFYVAAPFSTIDFQCSSGKQIPIEERSPDEVLFQTGPAADGKMHTIRVAAPESPAQNPAFDVTPAQLISGIITEKGILKPSEIQQYSSEKT